MKNHSGVNALCPLQPQRHEMRFRGSLSRHGSVRDPVGYCVFIKCECRDIVSFKLALLDHRGVKGRASGSSRAPTHHEDA